MACFDNVQIKQLVTYSSSPDTNNGWLAGTIQLDILNIGGEAVEGTITVDRVRQQPIGDLSDPAISESGEITSDSQSFDFKFYYPESEPSSITINVSVSIKVADCFYNMQCNHVLLTPNPTLEISSCLLEVQGFDAISGCTDAAFFEYNPNANVDDGSCATLIPILGCTNPLASNYNPNATQNDGSCVFKSGCTNPIANNYDSSAVIDDGTCQCGDINYQFDFFQTSGESFILSGDCQYIFEFDLITKIDCEKLLAYFENDTRTILEILNELKINIQVHLLADDNGNPVEYTGGELMITGTPDYILAQEENIFEFNIENNPIGIGLTGQQESCDTLLDLIATELGLECQSLDASIFDVSWQRQQIVLNSDLVGVFSRFLLNFEQFRFGICTYIDNVRFYNVCTKTTRKCTLVPSRYGFELERVKDNKKSWVTSNRITQRTFEDLEGRETNYTDYDSRLIFNSKELELQINPMKYVESDVVEYFNFFENFYKDVDSRLLDLNQEKIKDEYIDVKNRQFIRRYSFLPTIYEQYQDQLQCAPSKGLDYHYGFEIINKVGKFWYTLIKQLVPATAIWNENEYILKNNFFHAQKHRYKQYSLTNGSGDKCAPSGTTINCELISDKCFDTTFDNIDDFFISGVSDVVCSNSGDSVCYGDFFGEGFFSGKIIRYAEFTGDTGVQTNIQQLFGFEGYDCFTGDTPVFGCTNPLAINYNPLADTDDGSCQFEVPQVSVGQLCINSGLQAVMQITVSGGVPPYQYFGLNPNDILDNGDSYSVYVIDAAGIQSNTVNGTVNCPQEVCDLVFVTLTASYDCEQDQFGYQTTNGVLNLSGAGGTAPYSFIDLNTMTPYFNGDVVPNGSDLLLRAFDANGCPSNNTVNLIIDCDEPECGEIEMTIDGEIETISKTSGMSSSSTFSFDYDLAGVPAVFGLDSMTFGITSNPPTAVPSSKVVTSTSGTFQITVNYPVGEPPQQVQFTISVTTTINGVCENVGSLSLTVDGNIIGDTDTDSDTF